MPFSIFLALPKKVFMIAVFSALAIPLAQAQTETVLYNFQGYNDGQGPYAALTPDGKGNFYGTTSFGGENAYGTVFGLSPNGGGGWNETVLYVFAGRTADGCFPYGPVIMDNKGGLYGTLSFCGPTESGAVFKLTRTGETWKETILYNFTGGADGAGPTSGLIMDKAGNLYGTTTYGGTTNGGTVFELSLSAGKWKEQTLYNFDGSNAGVVMDSAGNIFGVGATTVFELTPKGNGVWNPTVLATFPPSRDGRDDLEGTPILDNSGNLYFTRSLGGTHTAGAIFELIPGKNATWTRKTLYSLEGGDDGENLQAGLMLDSAGNIYGTTVSGGLYGWGTVFELVPPVGPGSYQHKILWSFNETDGESPYGTLLLDNKGNLYGTTVYGGSGSRGVAFEITP
jgi:uncharacterized repeat protein (TIGR03803 family)